LAPAKSKTPELRKQAGAFITTKEKV